MYRKNHPKQLSFEDFYLPFGGKLRSDNRWVLLSKMVPWDLAEEIYSEHFSKNGQGAPALSARVALGALIIKERLGVSDEEAVEQIRENPYLQYFLGFHEFNDDIPFDPSMYVHFRKRFTIDELNRINEAIVLAEDTMSKQSKSDNDDDDDTDTKQNKGKLVVDATCAPADIHYPTDAGLLNKAREKSEEIIDVLFEPLKGSQRKPRTYRLKARKLFLNFAKRKKTTYRQRRKIIRQQLSFLKRNLKTIDKLSTKSPLTLLSFRQYRNLLVISEIYRQQHYMYKHHSKSISDRIVSISQPHIRPIVRGKTATPCEFGAKLSASLVDGYVFLDRLDWNSYNESGDLKAQIEFYKERFGFYPESVHCDRIYRNRENRQYCKERNIRISGPALGRPPKDGGRALKHQQHQDEIDRIPIEGKFGQAKRRFSMNRIMAKLASTSEAVIAIIFMVMNLEKWLKQPSFCPIYFLVNRQLIKDAIYEVLKLLKRYKKGCSIDNFSRIQTAII